MTVTDLTAKGKSMTTVWLDGKKVGVLSRKDVSVCGLDLGVELSAEQWKKIESERILPRGRQKALELLQLQDRTTKELHDRLLLADYTEEQVWEIIAYVMSFHYIDEDRFVDNYIRNHARTKSRREIQRALLLKGIETPAVDAAYRRYEQERREASEAGDATESAETAAVRQFVANRIRGAEMTPEKRKKIFAALMRKGFAYGSIRTVLSEYGAEVDYEENF